MEKLKSQKQMVEGGSRRVEKGVFGKNRSISRLTG